MVFLSAALFAALGCNESSYSAETDEASPPPSAPAVAVAEDPVRRGEYLVAAGGCHDCHTPMKMGEKGPEHDMSLALSGHPAAMTMPQIPLPEPPWMWVGAATNTAFRGPWGVSYSANLTSDATGIGNWTQEMFIGAIREGKRLGTGRPILPPMPWPAYRNYSDEDLKAIFAYLKSTKPIANRPPDWQPPSQ